jgi:phosphoserine phosphatase
MKQNNFSKDFWIELELFLKTYEESHNNKQLIAAFDADGTLWPHDMGEGFCQWQFKNCKLPGLPSDPWAFYRKEKETGDPRKAYVWLAQINQGQTLNQVQAWAEEYTNSLNHLEYFEAQKQLIQQLLQNKVKVYVVTASVKWAVEPAARQLGVAPEFVLGVETKIHDGKVTNTPATPITWKEGKAINLLRATQGERPFLCAGNTLGDVQLIETSTKFKLAVGSAKPGEEMFEAEQKLFSYCKNFDDWVRHHFYADPMIFDKS